MAKAILKTNFHFDGQKSLYEGKVRDVYNIDDRYLAMVVSDRISAFDVVLPKGIPFSMRRPTSVRTGRSPLPTRW